MIPIWLGKDREKEEISTSYQIFFGDLLAWSRRKSICRRTNVHRSLAKCQLFSTPSSGPWNYECARRSTPFSSPSEIRFSYYAIPFPSPGHAHLLSYLDFVYVSRVHNQSHAYLRAYSSVSRLWSFIHADTYDITCRISLYFRINKNIELSTGGEEKRKKKRKKRRT